MQLSDLFNEFPVTDGDVIPLALQQLLREPLNVCDDWSRAEKLLLDAQSLMPERMEITVALYKMYAYSNRHAEALNLIDKVLMASATDGGFDSNWKKLNATSAAWKDAHGTIRFYLYSLKAKGFVLLRSGELEQAVEVLHKLLELDPLDQVGGSVVFQMAERLLEDEAESCA